MIIAPGNPAPAGVARVYGRKMISTFFPSGSARPRHAKPEGKKEVERGGSLPMAAAAEALPWSILGPPLRGYGTANRPLQPTPDSDRAGQSSLF